MMNRDGMLIFLPRWQNGLRRPTVLLLRLQPSPVGSMETKDHRAAAMVVAGTTLHTGSSSKWGTVSELALREQGTNGN